MGKVLAMTFLNYAEAVKDPAQFESEVLTVEVDPQELEVAKTLASALAAEDFNLAEYPDKYKQNVRRLIESKVKGKEVIAPPAEEAPTAVINLMDALQKSVAAAKKSAAARPPRLVAPGTAARAKQQRKRKTS
jgi:DNA end-binding protein Ku